MYMAGGSAPVSVEQLRAFAAARVEADGLRSVARAVGVEPNGLKYFLGGGAPRSTTRRKFEDWYLRTTAAMADGPQGPTEATALSVLVREVPAARRQEAFRRAVVFYQQLYDSMELPRPRWLQRLVKED